MTAATLDGFSKIAGSEGSPESDDGVGPVTGGDDTAPAVEEQLGAVAGRGQESFAAGEAGPLERADLDDVRPVLPRDGEVAADRERQPAVTCPTDDELMCLDDVDDARQGDAAEPPIETMSRTCR